MRDRLTILVCEDEHHLRHDICAELGEAGYLTLPAADGHEALLLLERTRPDLILCDIAMPQLDGREVLARLRETRADLADVPFLFLSAFGERRDIIDGKLRGADDYIVKPVDYEVLLATIGAHLRQVRRISAAGTAKEAVQDTLLAFRQADRGSLHALDRLSQGIVLLDREAVVLHANAAARELCRKGSGLRLERMLEAEMDPQALRLALRDALAGEAGEGAVAPVPTERPDRRKGPILLLSRMGGADDPPPGTPALMVVIVDPGQRVTPDPELLRQALGLTPTEARICSLLASGLRSDAVAGHLGISPMTVAGHLKSIFAKTETHRQTDLIALLLSLSAIPPAPARAPEAGGPTAGS